MPLTNSEKQQRFRDRRRQRDHEIINFLYYLADHRTDNAGQIAASLINQYNIKRPKP